MDVYVWLPVMVKTPLETVMVPVEVLPSPQLMVAVKSLSGSAPPGSVKVATLIVPVPVLTAMVSTGVVMAVPMTLGSEILAVSSIGALSGAP